jgi:hypothetical protein
MNMKIKITESQSKMLNEGFRDEQNSASLNFRPVVGMENMDLKSPGYKGRIEHVGEDYFVLRSARGGEPVLIKPFQYHGFINYKSDNSSEME